MRFLVELPFCVVKIKSMCTGIKPPYEASTEPGFPVGEMLVEFRGAQCLVGVLWLDAKE